MQKKILNSVNNRAKILLILVVTFMCIGLLIPKSHAMSFTLKPGDILITKSTSSAGITGHAGIVTDSTHVLHTSGWKSEPYPLLIDISRWKKRYPTLKIIRPSDSALGKETANKAIYYFHGSNISYDFTFAPDPTNIKKTY